VLSRLAAPLAALAERWVPSAFTIAVLLTVVIVVAAATLTEAAPAAILGAWGDGFWTLGPFAMQMALVVLTGYLVSTAPVVDRLFARVARLAGPPARAAVLMAGMSMTLAWIHWGLSLVGSAVLLRHVARAQPLVDYRLLVTCAYLGMGTTWHAGLSGSVPLLMATPGHFLEPRTGLVPLASTTFSAFNLALVALVAAVMLVVVHRLHPPPAATVAPPAAIAAPPPAVPPRGRGFAAWSDQSRAIALALGLAGAAWLLRRAMQPGPFLTLDVLNFTFLMLAVLLHPNLASLTAAGDDGARLLAGIVLQFPLYAGMFGIIDGTGLARVLGEAIARTASADSLPLLLYWYSSVLNYFVPSGGSKWAVEAPFLIDAATRLGVGLDRAILAYSWGDMASNLIQPFWALPLLAAAGLGFRAIMGYAAVCFLVISCVVSAAFWVLPRLG
jgi:short-chain fatty acids transporter